MPRDGSGIYSQPFPAVVEGTTIESTVYNGYTADITIDLNTPRPISSGGTGANNAADAMAALGGEGSKIEVTNYDSHAFTAGSFYSKASASNPPVAGHAFAGICYVAVVSGVATSDMFIEVRDRDEATQPGSLFVRQKKNGTWSGWLKAVGTTTGATAPTAPTDGMLWWDPTQGKLFIWYSDPNTAQWVEAVATPDLGPDDFVSVDVAQSFTEAEKKTARSNIYAAPFDALSYNGMQINGSMEVSQELGTTGRTTAGYVLDGWRIDFGGTMTTLAAQSTSITPGLSNSLYINTGTGQPSLGAGDYSTVTHFMEGYRVARLAWGTASAQPITIGFWSKHSPGGLFSVSIQNGAPNRTYIAQYTHATAGVAQYNMLTIPGDVTGTWAKDNTKGINLTFTRASGTTYITSTIGAWQAGGFIAGTGQVNNVAANGNEFILAGLVVLPGIEAPSAARSPLIMRPYDQELVTCKRYFQQSFVINSNDNVGGGAAVVLSATRAVTSGIWPVEMRSAPTLTIYNPSSGAVNSILFPGLASIPVSGSPVATPKGWGMFVDAPGQNMLPVGQTAVFNWRTDARL